MKHLALAVLLTLASLVSVAHAVQDKVVAVVNSNIITEGQVRARTALRMKQLGVANPTPQQNEGLAKRTLGDMIDEELQRQYAENIGLSIPDPMVADTIKNIQANTPALANLSKQQSEAMNDQVRGELRWAAVTAQVVRPQIEVSNAETDQIIADMAKSRHVLEREISQIFMSVDDSNEASVRAKMDDVLKQLQAGGNFETLARTTSEDSASAINGGRMGWFASGELNPQLEEALNSLQPGHTSGLIRTPLGFHVIRLENVRTTKPVETAPITELNLISIARPLNVSETEDQAFSQLKDEVIKRLNKPADITERLATPDFQTAWPASSNLGWVNAADLQSGLQQIAATLKPGEWSSPFLSGGNATALYLVESRQTVSPQLVAYRERVKEHLLKNRLELASRRLMRDLRAKAFVDIRW